MTLPAITSVDPPQQAVTKLSKALGVTLPSSFGQITLVKSSDLATVQKGVKAFDRLTLVLPLIAILLIALSLWLSVNRRRTVLQLAVGVSLLMIVERRVVIHEQGALASAAHNPQVAHSVLGELLHGFFVLTAWVLAMTLVVLVIAVLSGPYRWAVAIRSRVTRAWRYLTRSRCSRGIDESGEPSMTGIPPSSRHTPQVSTAATAVHLAADICGKVGRLTGGRSLRPGRHGLAGGIPVAQAL